MLHYANKESSAFSAKGAVPIIISSWLGFVHLCAPFVHLCGTSHELFKTYFPKNKKLLPLLYMAMMSALNRPQILFVADDVYVMAYATVDV
jgi:hypothetical protein